MKDGWKTSPLGELCEFQRGLTYKKGDEVDFSNNAVLRANNIDLSTGELNLDEIRYIADSIVIPEEMRVRKESIVICTASGSRSHLGKAVYIDDNYGYAFGGFMGQINPGNELVGKYLFYLMQTVQYRDFIGALSASMNINNLKFGDLSKLPVRYGPRKEQERIVAILDEAFEGIATAKANAEANLDNVRYVLDSELYSLLSRPGNGWKPLTLAEVASDYGRGKSKHRPRNDSRLYGGPYPFVQTGDIRNAEQFITNYTQTYNERGLSQSKLWPKGTLCITIAANIAETAILDFDACFPDSVIGVVANPLKANTRFIEYQLRVAKAQLQAKGKGSAQDNINLGTFETHTFFFPPPRIQEKIVGRLDSLASIAASLAEVIEQKVALLEELKQSLLHQAFTGKL